MRCSDLPPECYFERHLSSDTGVTVLRLLFTATRTQPSAGTHLERDFPPRRDQRSGRKIMSGSGLTAQGVFSSGYCHSEQTPWAARTGTMNDCIGIRLLLFRRPVGPGWKRLFGFHPQRYPLFMALYFWLLLHWLSTLLWISASSGFFPRSVLTPFQCAGGVLNTGVYERWPLEHCFSVGRLCSFNSCKFSGFFFFSWTFFFLIPLSVRLSQRFPFFRFIPLDRASSLSPLGVLKLGVFGLHGARSVFFLDCLLFFSLYFGAHYTIYSSHSDSLFAVRVDASRPIV
jgi:hypothetical protein